MARVIRRFWAKLWGYFWLPCPLCGEYLGGNEWIAAGLPSVTLSDSRGTGVCGKCAGEAERINSINEMRVNLGMPREFPPYFHLTLLENDDA